MAAETLDASVDFDAQGHASAGRPGLVVVFSGGAAPNLPIAVGRDAKVLGRELGKDGALPDDRLSRRHAEVRRTDAGWEITDLGSKNGTFLDGAPLSGTVRVTDFRVLRLGDTVLVPSANVLAGPAEVDDTGRIVGASLRQAFAAVARAAAASPTVLFRGESGTGKELAARIFHERGPGAKGPFVAVNCAAIPEGLAERLLFGAKKGAYSGATADAPGYVRAAHGGVLFLDEGAELDLRTQAKLLRVLESREVVPLGASRGEAVDVRVCVATHRDLRAAVVENRFRADLYHRIAPPEVTLPRLWERRDEIALHVAHVVAAVSRALRPHAKLIEACLLREWPGNVRELHKNVRAAAALALAEKSESVRDRHLPEAAGRPFEGASAAAPPPAEAARRGYVRWSQSLDRGTLERALAENGSVAEAARALGMQRTQMYREMARFDLKPNTQE